MATLHRHPRPTVDVNALLRELKPFNKNAVLASVKRQASLASKAEPIATPQTQKQKQSAAGSPPPVVKVIGKKRKNKGGRNTVSLHAGAKSLPPLPPPPADVVDDEFASVIQTIKVGHQAAFDRIDGLRSRLVATGRHADLTAPGIDTMTIHFTLDMADGSLAYIDGHLLESLLAREDVKQYNEDTIERQPDLQALSFNGARSLTLCQDKAQGKNAFNIKLLQTMGLHVTGPKSIDDILGIAEYGRGLVEKLRQRDAREVRLKNLKIQLINTSFSLGAKVDLGALWDRVSADEHHGPPSMRAHQVTYRSDKSVALRYKVFINYMSSEHWPFVQIFESGAVILQSNCFDTIAVAYEHATRFALIGGGAP